MAALPQSRNLTDRAFRYRAAKNMPEGEKRCALCGTSAGLVEVGHVDGHEEHDEPQNLMWTCRPCNVKSGNAMRRAGVGRLTRQYNPDKGATSLGQWLTAVQSMKGESDAMSVQDAVQMIRDTPAKRRSQFASDIWAKRRQRGNPATRSNLWPFSSSKPAKKPSAKRSSMTAAAAARTAYKAGQESGDTGLFDDWAESKGLQGRGASLRQAYDAGVTGEVPSNAPTWLKSLAAKPAAKSAPMSEATRRTIYRDVQYKGFRIYPAGDGFKTSPGDGTEFEDVKEAKRFIDDEAKMRRNPIPYYRAVVTPFHNGKQAADRIETFPTIKEAHKWARSMVRHISKQYPRVKGDKWTATFKIEKYINNPKRRRNSAEAADYMYSKFHGKDLDGAVIVQDEEHVHEHLAVLGKLIEIRVDCVTGIAALLSFEDDPPFLCSTEDGSQLYIEAGDQDLDLKALGFDSEQWMKERMVIGRFSPPDRKEKWNIGYQTEKDFDDFEEILYQHDLGEETSLNGKTKRVSEEDRVRPFLEYEPRNKKLFITGGQYCIKLPLLGTSPGIEN